MVATAAGTANNKRRNEQHNRPCLSNTGIAHNPETFK